MRISVSMIALDEERNIGRALSSCAFADEVVIVDGGSDDATRGIAETFPKVRVVTCPWEGDFARQRQVSLSACTGDWVVRLDADEAFSEPFEREIRTVVEAAPAGLDCFTIRQCNLVGNERYYARALDEYEAMPRIFRNLPGLRWERPVHEFIPSLVGRPVARLPLYVVHYGFLDKSRYWRKGEAYARMAGSGFGSPESLVFREYDVQPRPPESAVSPRVPPYDVPDAAARPRIAVVEGRRPALETASFLWNHASFPPVAIYTFHRRALPSAPGHVGIYHPPAAAVGDDASLSGYMVGLEGELVDKDVVIVTDPGSTAGFQAAEAKKKFGFALLLLDEGVPAAAGGSRRLAGLPRVVRGAADIIFVPDDDAARTLACEGVPPLKLFSLPFETAAAARAVETVMRALLPGTEARG